MIDVDELLKLAVTGPYTYEKAPHEMDYHIRAYSPEQGKILVGLLAKGLLNPRRYRLLGLSDSDAIARQQATGKLLASSWDLAIENKKLKREIIGLKGEITALEEKLKTYIEVQGNFNPVTNRLKISTEIAEEVLLGTFKENIFLKTVQLDHLEQMRKAVKGWL
jgi:hypothetical protein